MSGSSKAYEYLQNRLQMLSDEKKNLIARIKKINKEINNNEEMIKHVSKEVDNAFEIFSPRQKKNDFAKQEIDKLTSSNEELNESLSLLTNRVNELEQDINNIQEALDEDEEKLLSDQECNSYEENIYGVKLLEQQENERSRIARDLHDSVVQVLANLIHKCEICSKILDVDPIRAKLELEIMSKNLRDSISEMRNIIYDLRPMSFDDLGLDTTLEALVNDIKARTDMDVFFNIEGEYCELSSIIRLTIFRVIQECTNNSIKHSKGKKLDILLKYVEDEIFIKVSDDGVGIDDKNNFEDGVGRTGFGLDMMRERVKLLNGKINISKDEGKGTTIEVSIPII